MGFIFWPLSCIACYWIGYFCAHAYPNQKILNLMGRKDRERLIVNKPKTPKFRIDVKRKTDK